ncbi:hypothetical protein KZX46_06190 [Polymorphobacter sp. PAMC 29334]|uniref:hypothetical protein n=1 Tax=Polymorphobacter sp. PAMC 29334 TaxID=2862331 RepID=UPI001C746610|nr:hypothetical protein [Polymorphobacter sp. PAMC 29334]QYE35561.1 hypothetical protein KZX46_06190 [Polymorphobacter sp. PAMC 29334]
MPIALLALLLAAPIAVPATLPPDQTITITGMRLKDYAAAVDACAAGPCSPKKDIVVSIRYAEALFRVGNYISARAVSSRRRSGAKRGRARSSRLRCRNSISPKRTSPGITASSATSEARHMPARR